MLYACIRRRSLFGSLQRAPVRGARCGRTGAIIGGVTDGSHGRPGPGDEAGHRGVLDHRGAVAGGGAGMGCSDRPRLSLRAGGPRDHGRPDLLTAKGGATPTRPRALSLEQRRGCTASSRRFRSVGAPPGSRSKTEKRVELRRRHLRSTRQLLGGSILPAGGRQLARIVADLDHHAATDPFDRLQGRPTASSARSIER